MKQTVPVIPYFRPTMKKNVNPSRTRLLCALSCTKSAILSLLFSATKSLLSCGSPSSTPSVWDWPLLLEAIVYHIGPVAAGPCRVALWGYRLQLEIFT